MITKPPVKPELGPFAIIDAILAEGQKVSFEPDF